MEKSNEIALPRSCLNKALPHEQLFVLLGRDPAAPYAIRCWIEERLARGLNHPDDIQVTNAMRCARAMEAQQRDIHTDLVDRNGRPD